MIITFKSSASGDVIMFGDVAKRMMQIMDKEATDKGIITVEQLPDAIARLRTAIAADKAQDGNAGNDDDFSGASKNVHVTLTQRAVPLLELLEWSQKRCKPVTWGV